MIKKMVDLMINVKNQLTIPWGKYFSRDKA
jgi:hypothetical protein